MCSFGLNRVPFYKVHKQLSYYFLPQLGLIQDKSRLMLYRVSPVFSRCVASTPTCLTSHARVRGGGDTPSLSSLWTLGSGVEWGAELLSNVTGS